MHPICFVVATAVVIAGASPACAATPPGPPQSLPSPAIRSLDDALALAAAHAPALAASRARVGASQGERLQAGVLPNPELSIDLDNVAGGDRYRGFRSAEVTYGLSQRIELGGKRGARIGAADAGLSLAQQDDAIARRDLVRDVTRAYADLAAAARSVGLAEEQVGLARELLRVAGSKVDAGKEPLIQRRKAEVALSTADIALAKARHTQDSAQRRLLSLIGIPEQPVVADQTWFETLRMPAIAVSAQASPDYARWDTAIARSRAEYDVEQASRYPDLTVSAGVRQLREERTTAFVVGVSVPLQVFDRNQGARIRAQQDVLRTEAEARQARQALGATVADLQAQLAAARDEADLLRSETLPAAEQAFAFARKGYEAGKFSLLEVLDAQRALVEARTQRNEALHAFHLREAELTRLSGTPDGTMPQEGPR